ncbi:MAG: hypothetical protein KC427_04875 [Sulfurovum sp.]|uniref:hypothetical protein n=1 Tax=Sulfurovum sp. TaxID=1969726 RepID=UPI002867F9A7|nr:hypothetical protein [Sulfurovum sp.]MCO4845335.1 hypothetical protein [Sulfurovum sp.]
MDRHLTEILDIESFSKKDTYSNEEKKLIMDRLNEDRIIHQRAEEALHGKKTSYTEKEKKKILDKLNEKRLSIQKREEIQKSRLHKKHIYRFANKEFYKFTNMEREYYIESEECSKFCSRPSIVTLYYKTISESELKKKDVLIKTELYSNKFFISMDAIRVYFKDYALEDEK